MHFWKYKGSREPKLTINKKEIMKVETAKFLGLMWDRGLTFGPHIQYIKGKCMRALNLLRVLSHTEWGADRATLLKLYQTLVRSKLDYGSIIYDSATTSNLQILDRVHNEGLRICIGAFRSSPTESLYVEANEAPLEHRRQQLSLQYALKLKANPTNPAYDCIYPAEEMDQDADIEFTIKERHNSTPTITKRLQPHLEAAEIPLDSIDETRIPNISPWTIEKPHVILDLTENQKSSTIPDLFKANFREIKEKYRDQTEFYTDGSKVNEMVGAAAVWEFGTLKTRLPDGCSIFSAEAMAILKALDCIKVSRWKLFIIYSDSLSCLQAIDNEDMDNPFIQKILVTHTMYT